MRNTINILLFLLLTNIVHAQEQTTTEQNEKESKEASFMMSGFGFAQVSKEEKASEAMTYLGIHPILLWKKNRFFFEEELAFERMEGKTTLEVEYAVLHYKICKGLELGAGKFLSPFGIFAERIHPSWVNKFSDAPLGFNHESSTLAGPMAEFGFEAGGALQVGPSKMNYVVYVTNGPSLVTNDPMMNGMLMYDNIPDNNDNKAVGGRVGFLPFSNSCFEVGISQQIAKVGMKEDSVFRNTGAHLSAFDVCFTHKLNFIKSNFEIKAQYNLVQVDNTTYQVDSGSMSSPNFKNETNAYFVQAALRPSFAENDVLKNFELAARYSYMKLPEHAAWAGEFKQITIGLNYWLNWRSVLKLNYQINEQTDKETTNKYYLQFGFCF
jgi:hypothetical protein